MAWWLKFTPFFFVVWLTRRNLETLQVGERRWHRPFDDVLILCDDDCARAKLEREKSKLANKVLKAEARMGTIEKRLKEGDY